MYWMLISCAPQESHVNPDLKDADRQAVAGQILVKFKEGTDAEAINRFRRAFHLETVKVVTEPNLYLMRILDGIPVEQKIQLLKEAEEVEYAEPNFTYSLD